MNRFTTSRPYSRPETICEICEHQLRFHLGANDRCPTNSDVAGQVMLPGRAAAVATEKAAAAEKAAAFKPSEAIAVPDEKLESFKAAMKAVMLDHGMVAEGADYLVEQLVRRPIAATDFHPKIEREKPKYFFDLKTPDRSTKLRAKMRLKAVMDEFGVVNVHGPIHDRGEAVYQIEMKSGNKYERRNKWGTI